MNRTDYCYGHFMPPLWCSFPRERVLESPLLQLTLMQNTSKANGFLQVSEALQGDETQSVAQLVSSDPQRLALPSHTQSSHHPPGPEVWQHLHHGAHGQREDRRPGSSHAQESLLRQECDRWDSAAVIYSCSALIYTTSQTLLNHESFHVF